MIAIDTNVLLRYLLHDDEQQASIAQRLITGADLVLLTDVVLVETIWTLKGTRYQQPKSTLTQVIRRFFDEPNICFESERAVWYALRDYENTPYTGKRSADFTDALIARKAFVVGASNDPGFAGTYTFDKAAQALPNMLAAE